VPWSEREHVVVAADRRQATLFVLRDEWYIIGTSTRKEYMSGRIIEQDSGKVAETAAKQTAEILGEAIWILADVYREVSS
jgi:hypothetical protein